MQNTADSDSRSPPPAASLISQTSPSLGVDTTPPSLTSGFGTVIEKEHDLQVATLDSCGDADAELSGAMERILRHQHSRLGANIALLEQRYEALPNPERFVSWRSLHRPPAAPRRAPRDETNLLPDLIARHGHLLADIETLIGCAVDGERGELILAEVSRSHAEMAKVLAALLTETEIVVERAPDAEASQPRGTRQAQEDWDNEGGAARSTPRR